jgi:hypothetical protein
MNRETLDTITLIVEVWLCTQCKAGSRSVDIYGEERCGGTNEGMAGWTCINE